MWFEDIVDLGLLKASKMVLVLDEVIGLQKSRDGWTIVDRSIGSDPSRQWRWRWTGSGELNELRNHDTS